MSRMWSTIGCTLGTALASSVLAACVTDICGDGTIERDGVCVPAVDDPSNAKCGPGTILNKADGECRPLVECEASSTTQKPHPDDPDRKICVGGAGSIPCTEDIKCPPNEDGKVNLCGRIIDIETTLPVTTTATGPCNPSAPTADGPCALRVKFFDPFKFTNIDSPELAYESVKLDQCGRFEAVGISPPATNFIAIAVDDVNNQAANKFAPTGIGVSVSDFGPRQDNLRAFSTKSSTLEAWSTAASTDLASSGAYVTTYLYGQAPTSSVKFTVGGSVVAEKDFYFSDTTPTERKKIDPAKDSTGANGTALFARTTPATVSIETFGGTEGGLSTDCSWRSTPGKIIAGVVFFQGRDAVMGSSTSMTPCPK